MKGRTLTPLGSKEYKEKASRSDLYCINGQYIVIFVGSDGVVEVYAYPNEDTVAREWPGLYAVYEETLHRELV